MHSYSVQASKFVLPPIGSYDDDDSSELLAVQFFVCGAGDCKSLERDISIRVNREGYEVNKEGILVLALCPAEAP